MGNTMLRNTLPEELVVEILLKLPVSSLLRCRCVCKSWYKLLKTPHFIDLHLIKNQNLNYIILVRHLIDSTPALSFLDYESLNVIAADLEIPLIVHRSLNVCGSCNGLICITDSLTKIILCNPSMREIKEIPPPYFTCPEGYDCKDSSISSIGFGFDSNTKDYKVVSFIRLDPQSNHPAFIKQPGDRDGPIRIVRVAPTKIQCLIYNVGINTWREIDHQRELGMSYIQPILPGVLFNGTIHWIVVGESFSNIFILCLDMSTEVFGKMTLPNYNPQEDIDSEEEDIYPRREMLRSLMILNDSLTLVAHDYWETSEQQFIEIWVMREYGVAESWTKQFTVGPMINLRWPLWVWKNESILLEQKVEGNQGQLVSCSFDNEEMNAYEIYGYQDTFSVLVNQGSLVSIY